MAAHVSYSGSPEAERAIKAALKKRGIRLTLPSDPLCVFQWSGFSKRSTARHFAGLEGDEGEEDDEEKKEGRGEEESEAGKAKGSLSVPPLLVSSFNVRTALVRKDELARTLDCALASPDCDLALRPAAPLTFVLSKAQLDEWRKRRTSKGKEGDDERGKGEGVITSKAWVIKSRLVNNALGVTIEEKGKLKGLPPSPSPHAADVATTVKTAERKEGEEEDELFVAQEYVADPVLAPVFSPSAATSTHHKFHLRVNVLAFRPPPAAATGASTGPSERPGLCVFVHRDVICHISCEPFDGDGDGGGGDDKGDDERRIDDSRRFVHLTNNGIQRSHPSYKRETHTVTLEELCERWEKEKEKEKERRGEDGEGFDLDLSEEAVFSRICSVVSALFSHLDGRSSTVTHRHPHPFVALPNAFEVFGFDFLLSKSGCGQLRRKEKPEERGPWPVLLEVNGGPALEGNAWPDKCKEVVEDTLKVVLDSWLGQKAEDGGGGGGRGGSGEEDEGKGTMQKVEGTNYWRISGSRRGSASAATERLRKHAAWALQEEAKAKARAEEEDDGEDGN